MKLIVCIDKSGGMMFFGKRQSQDSVLRDRIVKMTEGEELWMSPYSAKQFENYGGIITDDLPHESSGDAWYFVEDKPYDVSKCTAITLYKWNRKYQADKFFDVDLKKCGFKLISKEDFKGSSHDRITEEKYVRVS